MLNYRPNVDPRTGRVKHLYWPYTHNLIGIQMKQKELTKTFQIEKPL